MDKWNVNMQMWTKTCKTEILFVDVQYWVAVAITAKPRFPTLLLELSHASKKNWTWIGRNCPTVCTGSYFHDHLFMTMWGLEERRCTAGWHYSNVSTHISRTEALSKAKKKNDCTQGQCTQWQHLIKQHSFGIDWKTNVIWRWPKQRAGAVEC